MKKIWKPCVTILAFVLILVIANLVEHFTTNHKQQDLLQYRSSHVEDSSNTSALFSDLKMGDKMKKTVIEEESGEVTVTYRSQESPLEQLKKDMMFNTASAMSLISNLNGVFYKFEDTNAEYYFSRELLETYFGERLSYIVKYEDWQTVLMEKFEDQIFLDFFYENQ